MDKSYSHRAVLLREIIDFFNLRPGKVIIDATIGGGGHAEEILKRILPGGTLIGIDRDIESLAIARERLKRFEENIILINKNFREIKKITEDSEKAHIDGILFDLGISSIQIESPDRGFSIKNAGPLDMRMDRTKSLTAKDLVNKLGEEELSCLVRDFGEERFHSRIARAITSARKKKEIGTTTELAEIIYRSIPFRKHPKKIHPATRTFQALRIRVNDELDSIDEALKEAPSLLKKGGRICVISFHSLEDRIVKNNFKELGAKGVLKILTKKPVRPEEPEISENPRARSAKLRAAEKLL